MTPTSRMTELLKMSESDLSKEIGEKQLELVKIRMGVQMRTEKDTAKLRRERRHLARLQTALTVARKQSAKELKSAPKSPTVPAPKKKTTSRSSSKK